MTEGFQVGHYFICSSDISPVHILSLMPLSLPCFSILLLYVSLEPLHHDMICSRDAPLQALHMLALNSPRRLTKLGLTTPSPPQKPKN